MSAASSSAGSIIATAVAPPVVNNGMETRSRSVACLLVAEFDLLAVTGFAHALSACGRHWNWRPFRPRLAALSPMPIRSGCGWSLQPVSPASELEAPDIVLVGGGYGVRQLLDEPEAIELVRRLAHAARWVVGVDSGLLLLAKASCLRARRVAAPPALRQELSDLEPALQLEDARVLSDETWISCASSAWSLDAGLELIRRIHGERLANRTASALGVSGPVLPFPAQGVTIR